MESLHDVNLSFGSSLDNPDGLQLSLTFDEDTKSVYGEFKVPDKFQGMTGTVHPGIMATMLDEIMTKINRSLNLNTFTGELSIRYLQSASINENLYLRGWFVKKNKKMVENRAEIENEIGKVLARGKGKYIEVDEDFK